MVCDVMCAVMNVRGCDLMWCEVCEVMWCDVMHDVMLCDVL